jgi:hypothetical protein
MLSVEQKDTTINLKWYQQTKSDGRGDTDRKLSDGRGDTDRNLSDGHADTDRKLSDGHGGTDRNLSDGHGDTDRMLSMYIPPTSGLGGRRKFEAPLFYN